MLGSALAVDFIGGQLMMHLIEVSRVRYLFYGQFGLLAGLNLLAGGWLYSQGAVLGRDPSYLVRLGRGVGLH